MLSLLHIENIAVIESADISFDGDLLSSPARPARANPLSLTRFQPSLGERAYRDMIRTGANKATVRAVFTGVPKLQWFEDNGVEYDPETIVQREIFSGREKCLPGQRKPRNGVHSAEAGYPAHQHPRPA